MATKRDLLCCNQEGEDLVETLGLETISRLEKEFEDSARAHVNYLTESPHISDWYKDEYVYPLVSPQMQTVLDVLKECVGDMSRPNVLEVGAGCGKLAKLVYDVCDGDLELTCVENNADYYTQMRDNFYNPVYPPLREIKDVKMALRSAHNMWFIPSDSIDFTYTHTVMMHMPFTAAVATAQEIARVTRGYVYHYENLNDTRSCVYPAGRVDSLNKRVIDYRRLYDVLGFDTLRYEEELVGDGSGSHCVKFLAKKRHQS